MPVVVGLIAGSVVVGVAYSINKIQRAKQQLAWSSAAEQLGGQFIPDAGTWYQGRRMQIQAVVYGRAVMVDHYTVSTGKTSVTYTRLQANSTGPADLQLSVYKQGFFSSLGKAFGTQDVIVGNSYFDDTFIIKASDEALCKAWINPDAQDQIIQVPEYSFQLKSGDITTTKVSIETDTEKLVAVIRATAAFADGGNKILEQLRAAARELRGALSCEASTFLVEKTQLEWVHRNFSFVLEFANRNESTYFQKTSELMTCIKVRHLGSGGVFYLSKESMPRRAQELPEVPLQDREFNLEHRLRADNPELGNRFNQELTERLQQLPFAGIRGDKDFVTMYFSGLFANAPALERVSEALSLLATTPEIDPYR